MAEPAYDPAHALALCSLAGFAPGLVFLHEKRRAHREALRVRMAGRDLAGVVGACLEHGDAKAGGDAQLWADSLHYLAGLEVRLATAAAAVVTAWLSCCSPPVGWSCSLLAACCPDCRCSFFHTHSSR